MLLSVPPAHSGMLELAGHHLGAMIWAGTFSTSGDDPPGKICQMQTFPVGPSYNRRYFLYLPCQSWECQWKQEADPCVSRM